MNHSSNHRKWIGAILMVSTFLLLNSVGAFAEAPSHDPSSMVMNNDGRYWVFTAGDGIWALSSSDPQFYDWRPETPPFEKGFPKWINDYVDGFEGFFWAPEIIKMGSTFYLYYACSGSGATAAIGLAAAADLKGPWTDRGLIVSADNAIDPAVLKDGDHLWITWGNWKSGIDLAELDPETGGRIDANVYHLVDGRVEGPALMKHDGNYYLFFQRGLCCNGVKSTYHTVVTRSKSITGPYTDERIFLPSRNGRYIGPGQVGYGEEKLTYHFYDKWDDGNAKLMVTTLAWRDGWPEAGAMKEGVSSGCAAAEPLKQPPAD